MNILAWKELLKNDLAQDRIKMSNLQQKVQETNLHQSGNLCLKRENMLINDQLEKKPPAIQKNIK